MSGLSQRSKTRWQFGILSLLAASAIAAVISVATLMPEHFPDNESIRADLDLDPSAELHVLRRETTEQGGEAKFSAIIHVADQEHRLMSIWCQPSSPAEGRQHWQIHSIHSHYDDGGFDYWDCQRTFDHSPTKAERDEFLEFVQNFR